MKRQYLFLLLVFTILGATVIVLKPSRQSIAQSNMRLTMQCDSFITDDYPVYTIKNAPPNSPIYWSSTVNTVSTGETNAFYNQYTDANGSFTVQGGNFNGPYGMWVKTVTVGSQTAQYAFNVEEIQYNGFPWTCNTDSVSNCLSIAQSKGTKNVWINLPEAEYATYDSQRDVKENTLIIYTSHVSENTYAYDQQKDTIVTYMKYRNIEVIHSPTNPVRGVFPPMTLPQGMTVGDNEIVVVVPGGSMEINGITVFMYSPGLPPPGTFSAPSLLVLDQDEYNPRIATFAMGRISAYVVLGGFIYYFDPTRPHPLASFIPQQTISDEYVINFNDFRNAVNQ
jgi:hypothetical protein